ncbi:MAG: FecR domain-containing protein, partial [Myxococcales bacterium]|nr:FecR domain-containing protein [Myxococcales bacterium]
MNTMRLRSPLPHSVSALTGFAALVLVLAGQRSTWAHDGPDGQVSHRNNDVRSQPSANVEWHPAELGEPLYKQGRINTFEDSTAAVTLRDNSTVALRANTLMIIYGHHALRDKHVIAVGAELERGALRARLGELEGGQQAVVSTPSAAAELAGGNSLLKVDEQGTSRIHNHGDGNAEVAANKGGRTRLARGMGVKVEVDRRASKPIPLPPTPGWVDAPRIFLAVPGHQSELRGRWAPIAAANSYFVEVARDVEGVDVISAVEVPASTQDFEIHGLPVGSYHVRVAAVDADQFESIPSDALDLELIAVDLLGPGGVAAAWPEDDATSPRPSVLPGTTFELPPGIRCSGSDGRLDARPLLLRPGVHEASCEDDQGRPVVAFPIEVVDLGVGLGDTGDLAGEIVRGQISTHEIRVAPPSGLALPSTLHVQAPAGVEVRAVEAVDEGGEPGLWRLTLLAGPEAPAEVALGLSFVDPAPLGDSSDTVDPRFATVSLRVLEPPAATAPEPAPERHMVELGLAGGLLFIAPDHGLYRPSTSEHR